MVVPLTALYPAITVVLSRVFLQEPLTLRHLAGLALALAAAWLLVQIVPPSRLGRGRHGFLKKFEITGKIVYYETVSWSVSFLRANGIKISSLILPKKNLMAEPSMRVDRLFSPILIILALGAFLLLYHLDHRPFWQDEAETARLAKRVLTYGVPQAYDGVNLVSQEAGQNTAPTTCGAGRPGCKSMWPRGRSVSAVLPPTPDASPLPCWDWGVFFWSTWWCAIIFATRPGPSWPQPC